MIFVLNASPLIHITRAGYSRIFKQVKEEGARLFVPLEVYNDVVLGGKEKDAPDAYIIEELVEKGVITVAEIKDEEYRLKVRNAASNLLKPLHEGETDVLALATEVRGISIVDESAAREVGRILNIPARGSLYLFTLLFSRKKLDKKEVISAFDDMVKHGWRISAQDYSRIKEELEKL